MFGSQANLKSIRTLGNVSSNMSTIAASRYSLHASAFLAICSASALALAEMAKASASPRIRIYIEENENENEIGD